MQHGYGFTYMIIAQVLFFVVSIALIVWLVKNSSQGNESAKDILNRRLARGEIGDEEYDKLFKRIQ